MHQEVAVFLFLCGVGPMAGLLCNTSKLKRFEKYEAMFMLFEK